MSAGKPPRVSVTVLNYNYARYLPACLDSILGQSFTDFELIVIDDCSKDESRDVLRRYAADPRVRILEHQENRGFVASLAEGVERSRADILMVVSADDLVLDQEAFARQLAVLDRAPSAALCFSAYQVVDAAGQPGDVVGAPLDDGDVLRGEAFLARYLTRTGMHVLHTGTMIRRSAYDRAGGYRRDLRYAVDFAMWGMLALEGGVAYVGLPLYGYRVHGGQMSGSVAGIKRTLAEVLLSTDAVFARAAERGLPLAAKHGQAIRFHLFSEALPDAFGGRRRMAIRRVVAAFALRPLTAVRSRALAEIILLLCLGHRAHRLARVLARIAVGGRAGAGPGPAVELASSGRRSES